MVSELVTSLIAENESLLGGEKGGEQGKLWSSYLRFPSSETSLIFDFYVGIWMR